MMGKSAGIGFRRLTLFFLSVVVACCLSACHDQRVNPNRELSLDSYSSLDSPDFRLSRDLVWLELRRLAVADTDTLIADYYTRSHYLKHPSLVWIDRKGIDSRADSILTRLHAVEDMGFNPARFRIGQIEDDIRRIRNLDFDKTANRINKVYARLEYDLTKAYFRFATGQFFGYTNPDKLFNRLDRRDVDRPYPVYYTLYALGSPSPKRGFYAKALRRVHEGSASAFLDSLAPQWQYYYRLQRLLNSDSATTYGRRLLMVNMERCRWRMSDYPERHSKYVITNIPSFRLRAVDGDNVLLMRMGCGSQQTKTPVLHSAITRMDINPQWIMPRSIVRKSIIPHLGNHGYFTNRHYFIRERATGRNVDLATVTPAMLESGDYLVIQEGGEGNALGRIIFRFDNDFSIYLHDTSSKSIFNRDDRDVSHGCIRVEKPFDLAVFLVGGSDGKIIDKIRYSMNADVSPLGKKNGELTEEQRAVADTLRRDMLVGRVGVRPSVPLFIVYFTLFPDADGTLRSFNDVYGYDKLIYESLGNYL